MHTIEPGARVRIAIDMPPSVEDWPETAASYHVVWHGHEHDDTGTVITSPDEHGCVLVVWDGLANEPTDDGDGFPEVITWRLPVACLVEADAQGEWEVDAPDHGLVGGFTSRREAETWAVEYMEEELRDKGEATQESCRILRVESHVVEVLGATRDDGSEMATWLQERGLDYEVKGYRIKPASP